MECSPARRRPLNISPWAVAAMAAALLTGACEYMKNTRESLFGPSGPPPPCPSVSILKDAAVLTRFRPGPGRDLTDVMLDARIEDVLMSCNYLHEGKVYTGVETALQLVFNAERGPAEPNANTTISYFVAIPKFYPRPQGRSEFTSRIVFPGSLNRVGVVDPVVTITIPLTGGATGADFEIILGFILDDAQIEWNRQRPMIQ